MPARALIDFVCGLRLFWRSGRAGAFLPAHAVPGRVSHWYHLLHVESGAVRWRLDGGPERALAPGEAVLVPPGRAHAWRPDGETRILWADFRLLAHGVIDFAELAETPVLLSGAVVTALTRAVAALVAVLGHQPAAEPAELYQAQAAVVARVLALGTWRRDAAARLPAAERLLPVLHAMAADPAQDWSRDRIAELAGLQRTALTAWFRRATGTSPRAYLDRLRMERAAELLLTTDAALADIAAQVGCCDAFHLSRRFKLATGQPPRLYRQRFRLPG